MKQIFAVVIFVTLAISQACAVTLTFDDIPEDWGAEYGVNPVRYYGEAYGINFETRSFYIADHSESTWGKPRSGSNVLAIDGSYGWGNYASIGLKKIPPPGTGFPEMLYASSVSGYFSTKPGVILEIVGYRDRISDGVGALVIIGSPNEAWENVFVNIAYAEGINMIAFQSITPDALSHFCVDDLEITFVPEPSSVVALGFGLVPLGLTLRRRRKN